MQFGYVPALQLPRPLPRNKSNSTELHAHHRVGSTENRPAIRCWNHRREPLSRPVATLEPRSSGSLFHPRFRPAPVAILRFSARNCSADCLPRKLLKTNKSVTPSPQLFSTLQDTSKRPPLLSRVCYSPGRRNATVDSSRWCRNGHRASAVAKGGGRRCP
jgi:hypothetical protein